MSPSELTKVRDALALVLLVDDVNQLGRDMGQGVRLRTVAPHRLLLAVVWRLFLCSHSLAQHLLAGTAESGTVASRPLRRNSSAWFLVACSDPISAQCGRYCSLKVKWEGIMELNARRENLIVKDLGGEVVVYDEATSEAHELNRSAALVWRHCDGQNSVADLARIL